MTFDEEEIAELKEEIMRLKASRGEPVAWIVHAEYPWVTMDPPLDEEGLPRTPLYR